MSLYVLHVTKVIVGCWIAGIQPAYLFATGFSRWKDALFSTLAGFKPACMAPAADESPASPAEAGRTSGRVLYHRPKSVADAVAGLKPARKI